MLKPTFFGTIQSSWKKYRQWQQDSGQTIWYKIYSFFLDLILSLAAVLPLLSLICRTVPFSYEVNDDAAIVQILDGSYTGTPDGHSIFVRYPLSWVIKTLYAVNPAMRLAGELRHDVNWYVAVIVTLEVFALAAVLFQPDLFHSCGVYGMHGHALFWILPQGGGMAPMESADSWRIAGVGVEPAPAVFPHGAPFPVPGVCFQIPYSFFPVGKTMVCRYISCGVDRGFLHVE